MEAENTQAAEARRLRIEQGLAGTEIARILHVSPTRVYQWLRDIEITPEQRNTLLQRKTHAAARVTRKSALRDEARRLRSVSGLSIKDIAQTLGVAQSSVSVWVREIELNDTQIHSLEQKRLQHLHSAQKGAARAAHDKFLNLRLAYQQEGRLQARQHDPLHVAGCMLYWAEGKKQRNSLSLVNSDPDMLQFYARFLRESLSVPDAAMTIHINCYTNNGLSVEEIEAYWLSVLNLSRANLRKTIVNEQPTSSKQKGRKLIYGVCTLSVYDVRVIQHVYGAIQEYIGIDKPDWLR